MRALYLPELPANPESRRREQNPTIMGAGVFGWSAFCALLEYGTYDAYFVPGLSDKNKEDLVADGLNENSLKRLVTAPVGNGLAIEEYQELIFVSLGPHLRTVATLRQKLQRYDAPVCGVIHSINSERIFFGVLQQYFAGLVKADLLLCSSRAGMKTMDVYIEEIGRLLPPEVRYQARRVLVPLGVALPKLEPHLRSSLRQLLKIGLEECVVLFFGRLSQISKGDLGPLLVATSMINQRGINMHLVVAGDDTQTNEGPRLTGLAKELGCIKKVTIWPNPAADDKHLLYSGADIFVSPSDNLQETFGLSVAEALAYGLPAVVSDWDGYRDIVIDGETGFLIPSLFPSNLTTHQLRHCAMSMLEEDSLAQTTTIDITTLSARIQDLVQNPGLRRRMGESALLYARRHFSWPVIVKRYEAIWEEAIQIAKTPQSNGAEMSSLFNLSLEKCFGHFATGKRILKSKCFISNEGREWLKAPARFYFLCHLFGPPSPQIFAEILQAIADTPGFTIAEVIDSRLKKNPRESSAELHWCLARLFKYGLVASSLDCAAMEYRRVDPLSVLQTQAAS